MTLADSVPPSFTLALISRYTLIYLGLQSILAGVGTVVHLLPGVMSEALRTERHPDLFVLDLETERDAVDMIRQIRNAAPTSKIILLSGVEGTRCLHNVFAYGVDGVILTVQPPPVVRALVEELFTRTRHPDQPGHHVPEEVGVEEAVYDESCVRTTAVGQATGCSRVAVIGLARQGSLESSEGRSYPGAV
ncbi:MAG: response regulator [Nitrospira sp.]|nr:response regulator [Nitrospira sp.]